MAQPLSALPSARNEPDPADAVSEVADVPVGSLLPADSPRLAGVDETHARLLARTDAELPPILVHRPSMRVIDGMHRLRAAVARGEDTIAARFFDGDESAAFVLAVQTNIAHGLPLSLADRKAAAVRVVASRPEWSDRVIAKITGLDGKTVRKARQRASSTDPVSRTRIGEDGKTRPVSSIEGRRRAGELILAHPDASLRAIARMAGIAPGTARDVRDRVLRGEDPIPERLREPRRAPTDAVERANLPVAPGNDDPNPMDAVSVVENLKRDPSLRFSESGRAVIRWLDKHATGLTDWTDLGRMIPPHCAHVVAELARGCAREWQNLAQDLERRGRG